MENFTTGCLSGDSSFIHLLAQSRNMFKSIQYPVPLKHSPKSVRILYFLLITTKHHPYMCLDHWGKTPSNATQIAFKLNQADIDFNKNSKTFILVALKKSPTPNCASEVGRVKVYHFP